MKNFKGEITSLVNGELKKEEHEGNYKINYTFDVITDSEIEKPDFNEYHTR